MYFKDFPKFLYDFKYDGSEQTQTSVVLDITRNVRFRKELLSNVTLYDEYDIRDGETPEIIAEKVYGNPNYHWIIMLANQKYDYASDFPLQADQLAQHCADKYNPTLYSLSGSWRISGGKIYARMSNVGDSTSLAWLTQPTPFTVKGSTSTHANFTINDVFGNPSTGLIEDTQEFYVNTTITGTPVGDLTITTSNREYNPDYFINEAGFKVSPEQPGAIPVSGVQKEELLNEAKRRIKIISPDLVGQILKQFKDAL